MSETNGDGNRPLLSQAEYGVSLQQTGEGARASYTVTCCTERRVFNLLWQAEAYYARAVRKRKPKTELEARQLEIGERVPAGRFKGRRSRS